MEFDSTLCKRGSFWWSQYLVLNAEVGDVTPDADVLRVVAFAAVELAVTALHDGRLGPLADHVPQPDRTHACIKNKKNQTTHPIESPSLWIRGLIDQVSKYSTTLDKML